MMQNKFKSLIFPEKNRNFPQEVLISWKQQLLPMISRISQNHKPEVEQKLKAAIQILSAKYTVLANLNIQEYCIFSRQKEGISINCTTLQMTSSVFTGGL